MDDFLNELVGSSNKKSKKTSPKIDSNNRKRRPPPSNRNILQFLDDLSINDENNENQDNNSEKDDIYKFDFDLNKSDASEGDKTEIKFNNDIFNSIKKNNRISSFESSIVSYLDFSLNNLSSSFISTISDLSEETFNGLLTERVTNFLNDINQEINDIFQSPEFRTDDFPRFQTEEITDNFTSLFSEINYLTSFKNDQNQIELNNPDMNSSTILEFLGEIETKKVEMTRFSDDFLSNFKIERNQLFLSENSFSQSQSPNNIQTTSNANNNEPGADFINQLHLEMEMKEMTNEIEKNFLEEKLKKIEQKKLLIEEKKLTRLKEEERKGQIIQEIIDSKQLLLNDIKNYSNLKDGIEKDGNHSKFQLTLKKVSDFSQQMFVGIAQCRMMINQFFQKFENLNQINASFSNQQQMQFQIELENINAQNGFSLSFNEKPDFIQQTREKLKELQDKRIEAKKSIENAS
ncbi:hypothetical protein M9Y10_018696 [Tritrichomonas musculus]|uniref:Uncharacterized protein n=1 Tax=Tritrichomonas musculus TaxID=1915356 RepID=A0ABR2HNF3_9EUKA